MAVTTACATSSPRSVAKTSTACGLRLGINHPGDRNQVVDYVLHPPGKAEQEKIDDAIARGLAILPVLVRDGAEKAMHRLHTDG